jgi:hypothetical protein
LNWQRNRTTGKALAVSTPALTHIGVNGKIRKIVREKLSKASKSTHKRKQQLDIFLWILILQKNQI